MGDNNPYSTPQGEIRPVSEIRKGSPVKAVVLGLLVDIGGTSIFGLVFAFVLGIMQASQGVPPEQIAEDLSSLSPWSGPGLLATALGLGFSLLGGYVCARVAKAGELRLAGVMAALSAAFGLWVGAGNYGWLENGAMALITVLVILGGATLGRKKNDSDRAALA